MKQDIDGVDGLVRKRIRALRLAQGLSLDDLAARAHLSASTLSRIENGQRRLALDQLVTLARALDTSLDGLVETPTDEVVSNAVVDHGLDSLRWPVRHSPETIVLRRRVTGAPPEPSRMRAHPGREWLVVLSGTLTLLLGERRYRVGTNQSAEFDTMLPHAFGAEGGPADVLMMVDREARRGHRDAPDE
jgi:transcriptional regulator with XRE-family HTH domain